MLEIRLLASSIEVRVMGELLVEKLLRRNAQLAEAMGPFLKKD